MAAKTKAELEAEVAKLKAENTNLKADKKAAKAEAEPVGPSKAARGWRAFAATVLVAIGVIVAPTAVVGAWAKTQLESTEAFVSTFAPLASDADVQNYIADQVVTAINDNVDIAGLTKDVFTGLQGLGLPDQANTALGLLQGPATQGIKSLISSAVHNVVSSDAFVSVVKQTLTLSHEQIIAVLQGKPGTTITLSDNGSVGIATGPLIDSVKQSLISQGMSFASAIPSINTTIVIAQSDQLALLRPAYNLSVAVGNSLPWIALGFVLVGIVVAVNRKRALFGSSLALGIMFTSLASGFGIGRRVFIASVTPSLMPAGVAATLFDQLTARMTATAVALAVLSFVIALVTWFSGLASGAKARRVTTDGIAAVRTFGIERGVNTGVVGAWLDRWVVWVRVGVAVIAALVLVLAWPLTPAFIIWTLVISALVLLLVELLRRPAVT